MPKYYRNKKRQTKRNKSVSLRKHRGKRTPYTKRVRFITGGDSLASNTNNLPTNVYYTLNDYNNDPQGTNMVINSRNLSNQWNGGNRKNTLKKMKGGSFFSASDSNMNNIVSSVTNNVSNVAGYTPPTSFSLFDQPVMKMYNNYNSPMV
jgi:hypothetical protein